MTEDGEFQLLIVGMAIPGQATPPSVPGRGGVPGAGGRGTGPGAGGGAGLGAGGRSGLGAGGGLGAGAGRARQRPGNGSQRGARDGCHAGVRPWRRHAGGSRDAGSHIRFQPVTRPGSGGTTGPILGVVSKSQETSLRLFNGRNKYNEWAFVATEATAQAGGPGTATPGGRGGTQAPGMGGRGGRGQTPTPGMDGGRMGSARGRRWIRPPGRRRWPRWRSPTSRRRRPRRLSLHGALGIQLPTSNFQHRIACLGVGSWQLDRGRELNPAQILHHSIVESRSKLLHRVVVARGVHPVRQQHDVHAAIRIDP